MILPKYSSIATVDLMSLSWHPPLFRPSSGNVDCNLQLALPILVESVVTCLKHGMLSARQRKTVEFSL